MPYVAHLLAVAAMVLEAGGDEDLAIAALLHDSLEDHPDLVDYDELAERFNTRVAAVVRACSDAEAHPKPPWRERKERYLARLAQADDDVLLVSLADKVHNAEAIARDLSAQGSAVWRRFNAPRSEQLWYYRSLLAVFERRRPTDPLTVGLRRSVLAMSAE